jgi:hypothetical protein
MSLFGGVFVVFFVLGFCKFLDEFNLSSSPFYPPLKNEHKNFIGIIINLVPLCVFLVGENAYDICLGKSSNNNVKLCLLKKTLSWLNIRENIHYKKAM